MLRSVSLGGSLCDAFSLVTGLRRTGQRAEGRSDQRGALGLAFCPASVESESKRGDGEGLREGGGREGPSPRAPRRERVRAKAGVRGRRQPCTSVDHLAQSMWKPDANLTAAPE